MERFNSDLFLTTTQVAELLSVHPSTVKRWCNDGDLDFDKTGGGHRRLHLHDVVELSRVRSIATFLDPFAPYEGHVWTAVNEAVHGGSFQRVHSLAMGWLQRGHLRRISALFTELGRQPGMSLARFCDEGIRGFMQEVGATWRSGRLRVGEEHMVTEALIEVLLRMRAPDPSLDNGNGSERPVAVVGSMEGDRHSLGSLCVRLMLERQGWDVFFLGADVPVEDFAAMQRARDAALVCVSFAPPNTAADMKRAVRILGEFYDPSHPYGLVLGGLLSEDPFLDDVELPFRQLGIFGSLAAFEAALDAEPGLGSPDVAVPAGARG
jgi:excisionase family DNA binding protein